MVDWLNCWLVCNGYLYSLLVSGCGLGSWQFVCFFACFVCLWNKSAGLLLGRLVIGWSRVVCGDLAWSCLILLVLLVFGVGWSCINGIIWYCVVVGEMGCLILCAVCGS